MRRPAEDRRVQPWQLLSEPAHARAGEALHDAAAREMREETGFACASVEPAGSCWAFGASTWRRHVVRALARSGDTNDVDLVYLGHDRAGLL